MILLKKWRPHYAFTSVLLLIYYYVVSLRHYFDQDTQNICQYNLYFLILLKMVVEICQDNFFLEMSRSDTFQNLHCAPNLHLSFLLCYYFIILLSKIKNNSLHILIEICQTMYLMCMLAKNVFKILQKDFIFGSVS